jgi:imidazolonepropionase-like amidohydrolase
MVAALFVGALGALGCRTKDRSTGPVVTGASTSAPVPPIVVPSNLTVLRGMRLIDGAGGPPIEDATLVIEGQIVKLVGPSARIAVPPGAKVIDLVGKTVIPGLVSNHAHLGVVDGTAAGPGHDTRENLLRQLAQYEAYGVTTITSLGFNGPMFYELQPGLHQGALAGADAFGADRGIGVPAAAPPVEVGAGKPYRPATVEEARQAVRETAARQPTPAFVKIWVDDFHGSLKAKMSPEIEAAVIDEAHQQKLRVAAHVFYLDDARRLVAEGVDVLAHGVRDRPVDMPFIAALKARHLAYVPTLGLDETFFVYAERPSWVDSPFFRHAVQPPLAAQLDDPAWRARTLADAKTIRESKAALAMNLKNLKLLHEAGVRVGFGTDSGATPLRIPGFAEHHELRLMIEAGYTPLQAITCATRDAALVLGLEDRGLLARGKLADLVVVEGNPALDIADVDRIVSVWHRGQETHHGVETFTP